MRDPAETTASPTARRRGLPRQAGFTLVEVMVAVALILIGLLGTIKMLDTASGAKGDSRAREGASNIARELLEDAHATTYKKVGDLGTGPPATAWLTPAMSTIDGGSGTVTTPSTSSLRTTVTRRGFSYTATVSWCSVDDGKDGYGPHSNSVSWCSDSTQTGSEGTPEDMKRVTATITYTVAGKSKTLTQLVTFAATGGMVAPSGSNLVPTSTPPGSNPPFVVSTSVANVVFRGTSFGAADMKFTVNGVEVTSGIVNNSNGTWDYTWPIAALTDGTYSIGAVAVDALGNRSQPMTIQVRLARSATLQPQNVTGGYNYVNPTGASGSPPPGQLVVELQWDANPEGSVTGYEVLRGATSVCGGQSSLANDCIDTNPPASGTTAYTVKTWFRDGAGAMQSVSTTYNVTAPAASTYPTTYGFVDSQNNNNGICSGAITYKRDLVSNFPTSGGTTSTFTGSYLIGCLGPWSTNLSMAAGTIQTKAWFTNLSTNRTCTPNNAFLHLINADGTLAATLSGTMP